MFEFLKKLFGGEKKEEQGGYIPQEYIIPKKSTNLDDVMKDETPVIIFSESANADNAINDNTSEPVIFSEPTKLDSFDKQVKEPAKYAHQIEEAWEQFEENGKTGYKDENGDKVIAAKFDTAGDFINGRAIITLKEKRGLIDTKGNYILEPTYDYIDDEHEGHFKLETHNRYGFANRDGKIVIPLQYLDTGEISEGLVWVEKEDALVGFIDLHGKKVIDFKFDYCGDFSEGLASATQYALEEGQEDKCGFIDTKGNFAIVIDYDDSGDFKEGLAPVSIDGKYTFINKKGAPVCEPIYIAAGNFLQGLSCVQLTSDGKWGYADKAGKLVIPYQFASTSDFMEEGEAIEFINGLKQKFLKK